MGAMEEAGVECGRRGRDPTERVGCRDPDESTYFSLLANRRYSPTVMAFFWMLYCVKSPDWPVTTCWMGAGMTTSSMSSYVCLGFHSFGGMTCETGRALATSSLYDRPARDAV